MAARKYKITHVAHIRFLLDSTALQGGFLWFSDYVGQSGGINSDLIEWYEEEYKRKMISMLSKRKKKSNDLPILYMPRQVSSIWEGEPRFKYFASLYWVPSTGPHIWRAQDICWLLLMVTTTWSWITLQISKSYQVKKCDSSLSWISVLALNTLKQTESRLYSSLHK